MLKSSILSSINSVVLSSLNSNIHCGLFTVESGVLVCSTFGRHKIEYVISYGDFRFSLYLEYDGTLSKTTVIQGGSLNGDDFLKIGSYIQVFESIPDNLFGNTFVSLNTSV